ncbi:glycerophosphodiester phosphodiesterase family protein [Aeromonas veronii]|uniref:glycerophosphodiester phosphodiesterase family protein n=1 Tax=Aeromonas veronii TaxID=654 RepID=UPI00214D1CA2|nr:glycerophosphodiester phosphodiesterase family protein [Aeromonas veronii]MCR3971009.1 glycerophosphodiester phosphodiesterase family protein [Aeromonas veronii]MCR3975516.1 glycerophosphodiester phosphodiesterase family protein [Aeromonas veronii]
MRSTIVFFAFIISFTINALPLEQTKTLKPVTPEDIKRIMAVIKNPSSNPNFIPVCAHRGIWLDTAAENSISALLNTAALGVECIEMDVRATIDSPSTGEYVIFHDSIVDRLLADQYGNPISGLVENFTTEEMKSFRYRNRLLQITDDNVLTLDQFIDLIYNEETHFPRLIANYDLKTRDIKTLKNLVGKLKKKGLLEYSVIKSTATPSEVSEAIKGITDFKQMVFTPIIYDNMPDYESRFKQFRALGVKSFELVIKNYKSPFLVSGGMVDQIISNDGWNGLFDQWPESPKGRFDNSTSKWVDMDDNDIRGNFDSILKTKSQFVISDHPLLLIDYLSTMGKRDLE